jgi:hypothetical protein
MTLITIYDRVFTKYYIFVLSNINWMLKYNKISLDKIINIFSESDYKVRFEKGNFVSGHAKVHKKKIIIVNKFLQIDMKINALLDLLFQLKIDKSLLSTSSSKFYRELIKSELVEIRTDITKTEEE